MNLFNKYWELYLFLLITNIIMIMLLMFDTSNTFLLK